MNSFKCSRLSSKTAACPMSFIRFFNAYPCEMSVDVYINGKLLKRNLDYQQFTDYYSVKPCTYRIEVFPSGKLKNSECPIADVCITLGSKCAMTIAIVGGCCGLLGIQEIYDPCTRIKDACKAYIRFVNLSPEAPPLDVVIAGGIPLFRNVAYTARTRYVPIDPGTYVFQFRPTGTVQQGLTMSPMTFDRGTTSTLYAIGIPGGTPPLELVASTDGNY